MNKQQLLKLEPHRLIEIWKFEVKRTSNRDDLNMTYHCGWFTMSGHSKMRKPRVCDAILELMNRPDYTEPKPEPNPYSPTNRPPYHWISVENELPERCPQTVLCVFKSAISSKFVAGATLRENTWYFCNDNEKAEPLGYKATHWQYLPALPE